MKRKSILLVLLATVLLPATINAAEEHAPRRPEKPYILLLGKYEFCRALADEVQGMAGQTFAVRIATREISPGEIAAAACAIFAINSCENDHWIIFNADHFKSLMPYHLVEQSQSQVTLQQLENTLLNNPNKALVLWSSTNEELPIVNSLEQAFQQNIFQMGCTRQSSLVYLTSRYNKPFYNWLMTSLQSWLMTSRQPRQTRQQAYEAQAPRPVGEQFLLAQAQRTYPVPEIMPEDSRQELEDAFPRLSDDAIANYLIAYIKAKNKVLIDKMFELLKLRYTNPADAEDIQNILTSIRIADEEICSSENTVSRYFKVLGFLYNMHENLLQK